jgi:hypothetical protein
MSDELNDNLVKCASLRGVENLQHRVLADFAWFVDSIIHHRWDDKPFPQYECLKKYYDRCQWNDKDALVQWSRLFLEYYEESTTEWTLRRERH